MNCDILEALAQSQAKENHDYMKKEVFECWVYRFDDDISDYKDVRPEDREAVLKRLEKKK